MNQKGFTVIEISAVILFLLLAGTVFLVQKNNLETAQRDYQRKTAINAMYYGIEEAFFKQNKYYPKTIDSKTLPMIDGNLFTDPNGVLLGQTSRQEGDQTIRLQPDYRYEPTNCESDRCQGYSLRASMEAEAEYVKTSRQTAK